jgi:hypothetical protein
MQYSIYAEAASLDQKDVLFCKTYNSATDFLYEKIENEKRKKY